MSELSLEIARWIGKSGFIKDWDRCQREADGLLEYLRERGLSLEAAPPPLDGLTVERLARALYKVDGHGLMAECIDDAAAILAALRDEGETT